MVEKPEGPALALTLRREIVGALRTGVAPARGLGAIAVGTGRLEGPVAEHLEMCRAGGGLLRALEGPYGAGKSFVSRWIAERALAANFAVAELQVGAGLAKLYERDAVYRAIVGALRTAQWEGGGFARVLRSWMRQLEDEVSPDGDEERLRREMPGRILKVAAELSPGAEGWALGLRALWEAGFEEDQGRETAVLGWLSGQRDVEVRGVPGIKGTLDGEGAERALIGLLGILRMGGRGGLLVVLDEAETLQRLRAQQREQTWEALRRWIDQLAGRVFPGLYILLTGTPQLFEGPRGLRELAPLAQRMQTDRAKDPRFETARGAIIRLPRFNQTLLGELGEKVVGLYPEREPGRCRAKVGPAVIAAVGKSVAEGLGPKNLSLPRIFVRKLIHLLDQVDEFDEFEPMRDGDLDLDPDEVELEGRAARDLDDIELSEEDD